jgi:outer membrane immunogenic protein
MPAKFILGMALAVVSFTSSATAADIPPRAYTKAPIVSAEVDSWTGCHVGGNIGAGSARTSYRTNDPTQGTFDGTSLGSNNGSGVIGGGQLGCDYQNGNWVFGGQGMFDGAELTGAHADPVNAFPLTWTSTISWLATATARLGYAVTPHSLLYIRGGAAWARTHDDRTGPAANIALSFTTPDHTDAGWTVGGGFEYVLSRNWSLFAEYNYVDLGTERERFTRNTDGATLFVDARRQVHMATVGLNYHFDSLIAPRY